MSKKEFWIRTSVWVVFALLVPLGFICWRYNLFVTINNVSFSGGGILGVVLLIIFLHVLFKYINSGMVGFSYTKQILNGVAKLIVPLVSVLLVVIAVRNSLDYFIQALGVTIISETIAIPVNPFPKWVHEKTQGEYESMLDILVKKLDTKEAKGEKK